jgi:tyrosyl-tRNA synthetase
MPKGRTPIKTKIINEINMNEMLYPKLKEKMDQKEQIYWICKLIEEGKTEASNVKKEADKLKLLFPKRKIEFLHGKMKPDEKDAIMTRFKDGEIDILTMLLKSGLVPSKSEARRAVEQGGVAVDGEKVTDIKAMYAADAIPEEGLVLRRGKKNFRKVVVK